MKKIVAIEEIAMFLLALFGFCYLPFSWWVFPALLLVPDLSMLGYIINPKVGAILYNILHHKALAIAIFVTGFYLSSPILQLIGIILFAHSSMDRALGYGLKYFNAFNHTHLGIIGKNK
ncbi:DUF4260 domain-containing protein [Pedobacter sp. Hv1]|uniref:DUF4260 domain-containing protein n=1 Tax=Pedobacter sp. Hv1 TaxID=1740090 RepID=UPI0006D8BD9C|nr:DUF4260 domain-containing protein [Pedobacter sp. Hv1]KQC01221.1 hypothetical protein AQF98_11220 [Pedobacter sp. Hv1]